MSLESLVLDLAKKEWASIVEIRRDIHQHPEVGFDVQRTAGLAAQEMKQLGFLVKEGVGRTGVSADLIVDPSFSMIALRADMDALPMQEMGDSPYKSKIDGMAHMCGHDAHTAMLIGAARILNSLKEHLKVNVRFVFQPNEENLPGGAPAMIADGVLDGVSHIFGLHVWPSIPAGHIGICEGPAMAQPDEFQIHIKGQGGHAAEPHLSRDPIVFGSQLVSSLQSLVARRVDPAREAVISVTQFHAGSTHNVIPESAWIQGTVRTFDSQIQKQLKQLLIQHVEGMAQAYGVEARLEYNEGYPVTFNHASALQIAAQAARKIVGEDKLQIPAEKTMGGEDFSYYSQKIPACFSFLGIYNEAKGVCYQCHDPRFDVDEDVFVWGMGLHAQTALEF
jgi:amidohydrolase